ncbi:putative mRNA export protein mlo3 [Elsinoe australis]|uniref:Putative mRNA export protein mlo3 n=1 Tax=Elsinoe australis TaxID=40998 RepID=A0A4U7AZR6_9PEZI|nr:putative mRNA export protein mlo3 [Elsinoe australis]
MSSKLDQSLDEIAGGRRGPGARRNQRRKPAAAAPAGGIAKKPAGKPAGKPAKATPTGPRAAAALPPKGDSKIIVSNLPNDVTEQQIKEYFSSTVGQVKKVLMSYNKDGRSNGVATIIFAHTTSAAEAAKTYNNVKVDGRPMRIEVVMSAEHVTPAAAPKGLKDRISVPKSAAAKPKKATAGPKQGAAATATPTEGAAPGRGRGRKGRKGGARPKKTAEDLDADMADYFGPGTAAPAEAAATNGTAPAAAAAPNGGEAAMEDEIM